MTAFLFLQRFHDHQPAVLPFEGVMDLLGREGVAGRGASGDLEFHFEGDALALGCTVVGDAETGVWCLGFEGPRFDDALRQFAWACMAQWGCAVFDDTLDVVYVRMNGVADLPPSLAAAAGDGVRRVSAAQQLWPDGLEVRVEGPVRRALRYPNQNAQGPQRQVFDSGTGDRRRLRMDLALRPEACNGPTLRVIRNLELRVEAALAANPGYSVDFRLAHAATLAALAEAPGLGAVRHPLGNAAGGTVEPRMVVGFVADREVHAASQAESRRFAEHARLKHRVLLDGQAASVRSLGRLLDRVHVLYRQERSRHEGDAPFSSRLAVKWAIRAGAYLGELIRTEVGGQWGQVTRGRQRHWVVRTHTGRVCHPHLVVLDHIINGSTSGVARVFHRLALAETRVTASGQDLACDIPGLCSGLIDAAVAGGEVLPLVAELPRERLDFSVTSLAHLDSYLARVARQGDEVGASARLALMRAAGAYLGEVLRSHAADPGQWHWVNYDDHVHQHPEFSSQRPREPMYAVFLHGSGHSVYPLAHVAALVNGLAVASLADHARQLLGGGERAAAEPAGAEAASAPAADADDPALAAQLRTARDALGHWRQIATRTDYRLLHAPAPDWLKVMDPLAEVIEQQQLLLSEGQVVWAALIQADKLLFQPGPGDLTASLVYSTDLHFDSRPDILRQIAAELAVQRGGTAAPLDEGDAIGRLPVPTLLTDREVLHASIIAFRKHLPGEAFKGLVFPVLTHPGTSAVMVLPRRFWPAPLVSRWTTA